MNITLTNYQKEVFDYIKNNKSTQITIKSYRQMGTTTFLAYVALYFANNNPGFRIGVILPSRKLFNPFLKKIQYQMDSLFHSINKTKFTIEFTNGSHLSFLSTDEPHMFCGQGFDVMILDNYDYMSNKQLLFPIQVIAKHVIKTISIKPNEKEFIWNECPEFANKEEFEQLKKI